MDFGKWMANQGKKAEPTPVIEDDELPDGFYNGPGNSVWVKCRSCERRFDLSEFIGREETLASDPFNQYCGGSERCIP